MFHLLVFARGVLGILSLHGETIFILAIDVSSPAIDPKVATFSTFAPQVLDCPAGGEVDAGVLLPNDDKVVDKVEIERHEACMLEAVVPPMVPLEMGSIVPPFISASSLEPTADTSKSNAKGQD